MNNQINTNQSQNSNQIKEIILKSYEIKKLQDKNGNYYYLFLDLNYDVDNGYFFFFDVNKRIQLSAIEKLYEKSLLPDPITITLRYFQKQNLKKPDKLSKICIDIIIHDEK